MDLQLYLRVLWRFRLLVLSGLLLACALALLSYVRPSSSGFSYRQDEQWASYATVLVSGPEFALSSSGIDGTGDPRAQVDRLGVQQAAQARYTALAILYSKLADSDAVKKILRRDGPILGYVEAAAVTTSDNDSDALPLISVAAVSNTPERARSLAQRELAALQEFLSDDQSAKNVAVDKRVSLGVVKQPGKAVLLQGRSKTLPIVIFLTVVLAVIGLAFVLENMRPRIYPVRDELLRDEPDRDRDRRSA